jgi:hypothetical protein
MRAIHEASVSVLLAVPVALSACSSSPKPFHLSERSELLDSGVEIRYSLARSAYRLELVAEKGEAMALSGVNEQSLEKRKIDIDSYLSFVNKASLIAHELERGDDLEAIAECKTPYTITLRKNGQTASQVSGCRSSDPEGKIGRLIQEGEFLFYSPNSESPDGESAID